MSLDTLLEEARTNEAKLARLQSMEFRFLDAASLESLGEAIVEDCGETFGLASVTLFLFDWDGALSRFLQEAEIRERSGVHIVHAAQAEQLTTLCSDKPWLGEFEERLHRRHFPVARHGLKSVALLPLSRRGRNIGLLAFGSADATRFDADQGTDFLQRLTAIVAVCVENSLNFERLRQLGMRDPLTHLFNRRYFLDRLLQAMNVAMRTEQPLGCIYADLDFFKKINDTYGHPAGDVVLCETARRLSRQLRVGEVVARMGGEEFAVMLVGASLADAAVVAERMRLAMAEIPFNLPGNKRIQVALSGGVAEWRAELAPASMQAVDDLLGRADRALLKAKQDGRDRIVADA
ncbi:MAG: sensor domain-containing diguanylate cyclase [Gammaproteobacteria bacterium]|nr:sensor domain-containing diguanylate cyclase [Gammaproteobacteria bacterium]